jgi:hypothetical protein
MFPPQVYVTLRKRRARVIDCSIVLLFRAYSGNGPLLWAPLRLQSLDSPFGSHNHPSSGDIWQCLAWAPRDDTSGSNCLTLTLEPRMIPNRLPGNSNATIAHVPVWRFAEKGSATLYNFRGLAFRRSLGLTPWARKVRSTCSIRRSRPHSNSWRV